MEKIITIDSFRTDEYGNTWVTDKEGQEHKIGAKRNPELHELVQKSEGLAVRFNYATYKQRDYIVNVELVKEQIDETKGRVDTSAMEKSAEEGKPYERRIDPQERGMFWKELGNRIGDGSIDRDFPNTKVKIKTQYYNEMATVTKVKFKD